MSRKRWIRKLSSAVRNITAGESPNEGNRLLLEFSPRKYDQTVDLVRANHGKILRSINLLPLLAVELPFEALPRLAESFYITKVWNDPFISLQEGKNFLSEPMAQNALDSEDPVIPEYGYTGKGIVVAVLDTGVFPHQDLTAPANRIIGWQDFVNQKISPYDDHGHGTEMAGVIAGNGHFSGEITKGMAPKAWLVGVKVFDQNGMGRLSDIIAGIDWCIRSLPLLNIKILCLSVPAVYQDQCYADPFGRITSMAWNRGITIFAPAATQRKFCNLPSELSRPFISVASFNYQKSLAFHDNSFSSDDSGTSAIPDLVVEEGKAVSLDPEGGYRACSGNATATAMAAGGAALILEKWPSLGPDRVKYCLMRKARNLGLGKNLQGSGLLNLDILGNPRNKASRTRNNLSPNMNQILPAILKLLVQNSANSGIYPNEFLMNLIGPLLRN